MYFPRQDRRVSVGVSRHRALLAAALFLLTFTARPAYAADEWFVAVGGTGTGTSTAPFGTIQAALQVAQPGDTITVRPGTYAQNITSVRGGVEDAPITLRAANGRNSVTVTRAGQVLRVSHPHIVIDGLVFDGQYGAADAVSLTSGASHFVLRNAEVRRAGRDCIDMAGPSNVLLEDSSIHHCLWWHDGRRDAHAVVAGSVRNLTLRRLDVHTFSGDGLQLDPGRSLPGWDEVVVDQTTFTLAPLPTAQNGFPAGVIPGENAVDTKTHPSAPRARLTITDTTAKGFGPGLITNMAAFNFKENVEAFVDRVTVSHSEIAFRVRGPGSNGGAWVDVLNTVIHNVITGIRYEDDIEKVNLSHVTFGRNISRPLRAASSGWSGVDVRDSLVLASALPLEMPVSSGNMAAGTSWFVGAAADNYQLPAGSPAIDAARTNADVVVDRVGTPRPQGPVADVGAYERPAAVATPFTLTATKHEKRPATDVRLAWTDPSSSETGFAIERSEGGAPFAVVRTVAANTTAAVDTGRTGGRTYSYRVTALHSGAAAQISEVAIVTMQLLRPAAPTDLTATLAPSGSTPSVTLRWKDNTLLEEVYDIYRSTNGSPFTRIASVPADTTTYVDTTVAPQTKYTYRVRATNATGTSGYVGVSIITN